MSKLIDIASAELGTKEIQGTKHNHRILEYAHEAGFDWVNDDETPWCSIFLNWVTHKAGYERSKDARSKSWRNVGKAVKNPQPGDVILFGTKGSLDKIYHVGIFTGFSEDGRKVFCLGGNQTNAVSISKMWRFEVAGYRRLESTGSVIDMTGEEDTEVSQEVKKTTDKKQPKKTTQSVPKPDLYLHATRLRKGHEGKEVSRLQEVLNAAGFDCGEVDGVFGEKTKKAVVMAQLKAGLRMTGKTNRKTRKYLAKILNIDIKPELFKSLLGKKILSRN